MGKCTPEDDSHQIYAVHVHYHHLHTDRMYSSLKRTERHRVVAWPYVITVLLQADCSQWSLLTAGATVALISSLDAVRVATLLAQYVNLGISLYYTVVQNLVYKYGNIPQTAESSNTPIHCAQHVQQSIDMSIQLPAGPQFDSVQMAEVVQQEYMYP